MEINTFELERFFAKYEFTARYLLSSSDCEAYSLIELLEMADPQMTQSWQELKLAYTESWGHPLLRQEIADIYSGLSAENVLVGVPEECIFLYMHALLRAGDHVICTYPGYQSLYEVAHSIGCEVSSWEPDEERGWRFDVNELARMFKENTRLVVANFPHNPTGYLPPQDDFQAIIDLARGHGAYLLSDEMYRFLEVSKDATLPSACGLYERATSLFGLSKTFGLPGLRIGWLVSQDRQLLERVSRLKDYTTICSSAPSEILAIIALRNKKEIISRQRRRILDNLSVLDSFFQKFEDQFRWNRPLGGSICFPRMTAVDDTYAFCSRLVEDTGIMLAPSRVFLFDNSHVRIGYGRDDLPEVIGHFSNYLDRKFR